MFEKETTRQHKAFHTFPKSRCQDFVDRWQEEETEMTDLDDNYTALKKGTKK